MPEDKENPLQTLFIKSASPYIIAVTMLLVFEIEQYVWQLF